MEISFKVILFGIIFIGSIVLLAINAVKLISYLKLAKPENRTDKIGERIKQTLLVALGQTKIFRDKYAGPIHAGIFWGFLVLLFSAIESVIQGLFHSFSWSFLGPLYTAISFSTDIFCLIIIVAIIFALYRRFIKKVARLQGDSEEKKDAIIVLLAIFTIVSSLLLENAALSAMGIHYEWSFKPVSMFLSGAIPISAANTIYEIFWWLHILAILAFINYLPFSKHLHVYTSIPNVFLAMLGPVNKLKPLNFEEEGIEKFGVVDFEDLTWKQILDSYTCTHCGRCDSVCPANITGKLLSPREIIVQIRNRTIDKAPLVINQQKGGKASDTEQNIIEKKFIGEYESTEALWQCTSCGACMKECPVMIEHVPAIVDMRRSLVMMDADFPPLLQSAFTNLENNATPWAFPQSERADWAAGTGIKTIADKPDADILFWVGCAGSYDDRAKKISLAFSKLMQIAEIDFAILGTEEQCNGDVARRTGNEYLADMLIKANVETMNRYNIKKIVTTCPHCFNTLKNEYPDFGGKYEVIHHSQFLNELIQQGKLKLSNENDSHQNIAYHDSCYLGRYNDEYDAPRNVISSVPGLNVLEPKRTMDRGLCCGAGGGQMFMEEVQGKRVNIERTEELLATGANTIAVNCPFCMTMISDGVKAKDAENTNVKDIAEILLAQVEAVNKSTLESN